MPLGYLFVVVVVVVVVVVFFCCCCCHKKSEFNKRKLVEFSRWVVTTIKAVIRGQTTYAVYTAFFL